MHWGGDFGMASGFGGFFMILFWAVVILGAVYLIKILAGGSSSGNEKTESAEEVLQKRFARGEMSKDEFEEAMEVLQKHRI